MAPFASNKKIWRIPCCQVLTGLLDIQVNSCIRSSIADLDLPVFKLAWS